MPLLTPQDQQSLSKSKGLPSSFPSQLPNPHTSWTSPFTTHDEPPAISHRVQVGQRANEVQRPALAMAAFVSNCMVASGTINAADSFTAAYPEGNLALNGTFQEIDTMCIGMENHAAQGNLSQHTARTWPDPGRLGGSIFGPAERTVDGVNQRLTVQMPVSLAPVPTVVRTSPAQDPKEKKSSSTSTGKPSPGPIRRGPTSRPPASQAPTQTRAKVKKPKRSVSPPRNPRIYQPQPCFPMFLSAPPNYLYPCNQLQPQPLPTSGGHGVPYAIPPEQTPQKFVHVGPQPQQPPPQDVQVQPQQGVEVPTAPDGTAELNGNNVGGQLAFGDVPDIDLSAFDQIDSGILMDPDAYLSLELSDFLKTTAAQEQPTVSAPPEQGHFMWTTASTPQLKGGNPDADEKTPSNDAIIMDTILPHRQPSMSALAPAKESPFGMCWAPAPQTMSTMQDAPVTKEWTVRPPGNRSRGRPKKIVGDPSAQVIKRGRGRPPGSKNKPKVKQEAEASKSGDSSESPEEGASKTPESILFKTPEGTLSQTPEELLLNLEQFTGLQESFALGSPNEPATGWISTDEEPQFGLSYFPTPVSNREVDPREY